MHYNRKDIEESLRLQKYDDIHATYLLLGRRSADVSVSMIWNSFSTHTCFLTEVNAKQLLTIFLQANLHNFVLQVKNKIHLYLAWMLQYVMLFFNKEFLLFLDHLTIT
jgi:hypothetical protein